MVECIDDAIVYKISSDDIAKVKEIHLDLHDEILEIESKYKFTGHKYDFTIFHTKRRGSGPNSESKGNKSSEKGSQKGGSSYSGSIQ